MCGRRSRIRPSFRICTTDANLVCIPAERSCLIAGQVPRRSFGALLELSAARGAIEGQAA